MLYYKKFTGVPVTKGREQSLINIAFCDDELSVLNELRILLDKYSANRNKEIVCTAFHSPLDLLAEIEKGTRFDILFLDIIMPGENGIAVATEIRNYDRYVKIIFLSCSSNFAVDSYSVNAYSYQIKPINEKTFFNVMDSAISTCERELEKDLILRCKTGITRIQLRHLEYCEVIHRTLLIHLTNGDVLECTGSLDQLSTQLAFDSRFLRVHRSYLVNLEYIKHLSYNALIMTCLTKLPIPRGKYREIKDRYLEYIFQSKHVLI